MSSSPQPFDESCYDFIAHLSARFGLTQTVVAERLGEWLLDSQHDDTPWQRELSRG